MRPEGGWGTAGLYLIGKPAPWPYGRRSEPGSQILPGAIRGQRAGRPPPAGHFRSTPINRHRRTGPAGRFGANSGSGSTSRQLSACMPAPHTISHYSARSSGSCCSKGLP
jgi:hypothetical protein